MCLPRYLRYLYLRLCTDHWLDSTSKYIDFSRLPRKLEEDILIHSAMGETVCFDCLPATMQFIYIEREVHLVGSTIVTCNSLPRALKGFCVTAKGGHAHLQAKVYEIGEPNEVRQQTRYNRWLVELESVHLRMMEDKMNLTEVLIIE